MRAVQKCYTAINGRPIEQLSYKQGRAIVWCGVCVCLHICKNVIVGRFFSDAIYRVDAIECSDSCVLPIISRIIILRFPTLEVTQPSQKSQEAGAENSPTGRAVRGRTERKIFQIHFEQRPVHIEHSSAEGSPRCKKVREVTESAAKNSSGYREARVSQQTHPDC